MRTFTFWGVVASALMSGCTMTEPAPDIRAWMVSESQGLAGKVEALPEILPYTPIVFEALESQKSPFDIQNIEPDFKKNSEGGPDFLAREKRDSDLEKYPLDSFTMIGSFRFGNQWMGVLAFDGKTQQVKEGQYLGMDFGQIEKITQDEIQLVELVEDPENGWVKRKNSMYLQKTLKEESKK